MLAVLPWSFWNKRLSSTVELNHSFQTDWGKTAIAAREKVELNRLFQIDRGKTASVARILSPNPTRQSLPCLLIQSFFYAHSSLQCLYTNNIASKQSTTKNDLSIAKVFAAFDDLALIPIFFGQMGFNDENQIWAEKSRDTVPWRDSVTIFLTFFLLKRLNLGPIWKSKRDFANFFVFRYLRKTCVRIVNAYADTVST